MVDILLSLSFSHCVLSSLLFQLDIQYQYVRYIEDDGNVTRSLNLFDATVPQKVNTINQMISGWDLAADDQVRHVVLIMIIRYLPQSAND